MRSLPWLAGGFVAILAGVMIFSGVSLGSALLLSLLVSLQVGAGVVLWAWLTTRRYPVEMLGMGVALGTGLSVFSGLLFVLVGIGAWGWVIFPSVVIVAGVVRWWRGPRAAIVVEPLDWGTVAALAVGVVLGLVFTLVNLRNYPLSWAGTWSSYHNDMPFFEALATSIARLGPGDSIFFAGGQIRYHWLTYAWSGLLSESAGAEPFVVLTRVLPVVATLGAVSIVVSWARRVSARPWVPTLAVLLLVTGGFLGAVFGGVLSFDSPSQSMGILWLLAYVVVVGLLVEVGLSRRWVVVLIAVLAALAFLLGGGKVSAAVPALGGIVLLAVIALLRRERWAGAAAVAALVSLVGAGLAYLLLLAGSSGSGGLGLFDLVDRSSSQQGLNPTDGMLGVVLGSGVLLVAIAARWAGVAWLAVAPGSRWQPLTVLGVGMAATGLVAVVVFTGFNEIWFALAAAAPLSVLTAQGVGDALEAASRGNRRARSILLLGAGVAAVVIYAAVWALWQTGASGGNLFVPTLRWSGPLVGVALAVLLGALVARAGTGRWSALGVAAMVTVVLVFSTVPGRVLGAGTGQIGVQQAGLRNEWFGIGRLPSVRDRDGTVVSDWTSTQMEAAAWLRANADPRDLLATNLTFGPFVPGVTRLPTYVSALQYQAPYGYPEYASVLLAREAEVWDFVDGPSARTVAPLCESGVRWIWVDPRLTTNRDWHPWGVVEIASDDVLVVRLTCAPMQGK